MGWLVEHRRATNSRCRAAGDFILPETNSTRRLRSTRSGNNAETANNGGGKLRRELKGLSSFIALGISRSDLSGTGTFFFSTQTRVSA